MGELKSISTFLGFTLCINNLDGFLSLGATSFNQLLTQTSAPP